MSLKIQIQTTAHMDERTSNFPFLFHTIINISIMLFCVFEDPKKSTVHLDERTTHINAGITFVCL